MKHVTAKPNKTLLKKGTGSSSILPLILIESKKHSIQNNSNFNNIPIPTRKLASKQSNDKLSIQKTVSIDYTTKNKKRIKFE